MSIFIAFPGWAIGTCRDSRSSSVQPRKISIQVSEKEQPFTRKTLCFADAQKYLICKCLFDTIKKPKILNFTGHSGDGRRNSYLEKGASTGCLVHLHFNLPWLKLPRRYTPALLRTVPLLPNPLNFTCHLPARNTSVKQMNQVLEPVTSPEGQVMQGRQEKAIGMRHFREPGDLKKMAAVKGLNSECSTRDILMFFRIILESCAGDIFIQQ